VSLDNLLSMAADDDAHLVTWCRILSSWLYAWSSFTAVSTAFVCGASHRAW
jgi:hypothetical protein